MAQSNTAQPNTPAIGEVQAVTGHVVAVGANGVERRLEVGDRVFADDLIKTIGGSTVVISLFDGTRFDLGRDAEALLDDAVYASDIPALEAAALTDIAELQAAIEAGADPTQVGEATAAGGQQSDNGEESIQQGVSVDRTGRVGQVEAGFETNPPGQDFDALLTDPIDLGGVGADGGVAPLFVPPSPNVSISITSVAGDNVVNQFESTSAAIPVTGVVGGDAQDGDTVTLVVNGNTYTGVITGGGFSIDVPGTDLAADLTIEASITVTNGFGVSTTATDSNTHTVDVSAPNLTVDAPPLTNDNTPTITGTTDLPDGNTITLVIVDADGNRQTVITTATGGTYSVDVPTPLVDGPYTVDASGVDGSGNTTTAFDNGVIDSASTAFITVDPITADDIVNATEAGDTIVVTGTVGGDAAAGDPISFTVNGTPYSGTVNPDGTTWSVNVAGSDLAADTSFDATVTGSDGAGNPFTAIMTSTHTVDTVASATITVEPITADDIVNATEAGGTIVVAGTVGGDAAAGDPINFTVNGTPYSGTVNPDGTTWSVNVAGSDLAADTSFDATVTGSDNAGNPFTATTTSTHTVDTSINATITIDPDITADDMISPTEAGQNVIVSGTVGGDVVDGDTVTLTINGVDYTGQVSGGTFAIQVAGGDLAADSDNVIQASVTATDGAGNSVTATDIESYSVAQIVTPDQTGLVGEYYGYNDRSRPPTWQQHDDDGTFGNLDRLSEVLTLIDQRSGGNITGTTEEGAAEATFRSTRVDYGEIGGNLGTGTSLQGFLGGDAASLSRDPRNSTDGIVRIIGFILVEAANMDFRVRSDDGFTIRVGDTVFGNPTNHAPRTDTFNSVSLEPGLQEIEIIYWDQGGRAVLEVEAKETGQPASAYDFLDTGDFGLLPPSFVNGLAANQTLIEDPDNPGQFFVIEGAELVGSSGSDTLTGTDSLDILVGGAGDDVLTGGLGADQFVWNDGDQGVQGTPAMDTITDFSLAQGDVLQLADLLSGEESNDLTDYLSFEQSGTDTLVHISSGGGFGGGYAPAAEDQTIVLQNVDLSALGGNDQQIIDALLAGSNLIVDS